MQQLLAFAAIVLVALPAAAAQTAPTGITLTAGPVGGTILEDKQNVIPYSGNGTVPVTLRIGCATLLQHAADWKVTVAVDPMPAWLTAPPVFYDFSPADEAQLCLQGSGFLENMKQFPFSVKPEAPGVVIQRLNFKATMTDDAAGDAPTSNVTVPVQVQFHPSYTITPSVQFPLSVECGKAAFDVTVANRSNAASMVMIEEKQESTGSLSGIGPETYDPPANNGTDAKVFHVEYKAPAEWDNATVTFKAFAHFLIPPSVGDYGAGDFRAQENVTWVFTRGPCATEPGGDTKPAPATMLPVYVLAIALAGLVARRK